MVLRIPFRGVHVRNEVFGWTTGTGIGFPSTNFTDTVTSESLYFISFVIKLQFKVSKSVRSLINSFKLTK